MPVSDKKSVLKIAAWLVVVFLVGVAAARFLTKFTSAAPAASEALVQKVNDDTLKLSDDALKNIKVTKAEISDIPVTLAIMGKISVVEDLVSIIASRVAGRIDAVYATSGEHMKVGQQMASVFSPDIVVAREEYLQTLAQVKATNDDEDKKILNLSKQKLQSMGMSAIDIDHISPSPAKNTDLMIRSPREGAVLEKKAVVGNLVNPGDPLFTVGDTKNVWFAGDVYPDDVNKIHKGQEIVIDPDTGDKPLKGSVSFISPVIDPTTRTIKVRAQMENPGSSLKLDMYVKGNVTLSTRRALVIPKSALVRSGDSYVVFKQMPDKQFKKIAVVTDEEQNSSVIVAKGLESGDTVVSDGALLLMSALTTSADQ